MGLSKALWIHTIMGKTFKKIGLYNSTFASKDTHKNVFDSFLLISSCILIRQTFESAFLNKIDVINR